MPFKRAGWLQPPPGRLPPCIAQFQCPLSGLVGCNCFVAGPLLGCALFQCPLSGLVGCNPGTSTRAEVLPDVSMPFKRAGWLQLLAYVEHGSPFVFQCPLSGLVGCNS